MPAEPRLARRPRVRYVFLAYVSRRKQTQRGRDFPKPTAAVGKRGVHAACDTAQVLATLTGHQRFMKRTSARLLALLIALVVWTPTLTEAEAPLTSNADEALKLLLAGNCRFAEGNPMFVTK